MSLRPSSANNADRTMQSTDPRRCPPFVEKESPPTQPKVTSRCRPCLDPTLAQGRTGRGLAAERLPAPQHQHPQSEPPAGAGGGPAGGPPPPPDTAGPPAAQPPGEQLPRALWARVPLRSWLCSALSSAAASMAGFIPPPKCPRASPPLPPLGLSSRTGRLCSPRPSPDARVPGASGPSARRAARPLPASRGQASPRSPRRDGPPVRGCLRPRGDAPHRPSCLRSPARRRRLSPASCAPRMLMSLPGEQRGRGS